MSTQSIFQNDLDDMKVNLDELFACASKKISLSARFGFKFSMTSTDTFLFNYLYNLVNNDTNCYLIFSNEYSIETINKLLLNCK